MPRNQYKKIADFLADESFQHWVRFKDNTHGWEEWTVEHPQRAKLVQQARLWILSMRVSEADVPQEETQASLEATWEKIRHWEAIDSPKIRFWNNGWWQGVAAVLVLGIALGWFYKRQTSSTKTLISYTDLIKENANGLIEQANNTDRPQLITLSDGSSVLLQPDSKLSYPKSFDPTQRKVYLSGEAFFEISKNPQRPFLVFANEIVTKVIGTSFRVRAYSDQPNVEVVVRTGKVSVSSNQQVATTKEQGVLLLPNQAVRFIRQSLAFEEITNLVVSEPIAQTQTTIEQLSFEFTDIPVAQILHTLEQAYLVEVDFPREVLKDCYLTTSLSDQPLPEKLKIICESLGNNTRYEMNGNHITIISNGCN